MTAHYLIEWNREGRRAAAAGFFPSVVLFSYSNSRLTFSVLVILLSLLTLLLSHSRGPVSFLGGGVLLLGTRALASSRDTQLL